MMCHRDRHNEFIRSTQTAPTSSTHLVFLCIVDPPSDSLADDYSDDDEYEDSDDHDEYDDDDGDEEYDEDEDSDDHDEYHDDDE